MMKSFDFIGCFKVNATCFAKVIFATEPEAASSMRMRSAFAVYGGELWLTIHKAARHFKIGITSNYSAMFFTAEKYALVRSKAIFNTCNAHFRLCRSRRYK
jgi:hypothetical protein